jgi:predicted HAD superfamily Cof-like phosphohydrolase
MEKQTLNAIKQIHKFNQQAGLLEQGYDDLRECAFPVEEMLEKFDLTELQQVLLMGTEKASAKNVSRKIMWYTMGDEIADVDRLDKHLDAIVFCFGSIFKLGLTPQQAIKALSIVADANMQKLTAGKDSHGKQMKPEGFIPPEEKLQKILDERVNNDSISK